MGKGSENGGVMDYKKCAEGILKGVGGKGNIISAAHCATKLRLVIADNSKMDTKAVENVDGVKGVFEASGQIQIIIGTGTVNKVYAEFIQLAGVSEATKDDVKQAAASKQNFFFRAIKTLGDVFVPIIPAIVASGLLNGLLGGLSNAIDGMADSSWYELLNIFSSAALAMLPILIAISAAKKFGGNPYLAAVIGYIMINPALVNAWTVWNYEGTIPTWNIFGIEIQKIGYQGHVIPVIISILFMSALEKWLHKIVPEVIDLFVTPLVTVLVTGLLTLLVIGPVFKVVEDYIVTGAKWLIALPYGIGGLLVGFFYAFTVVAGFHHMYNMIEAQMLGTVVNGVKGLNTWMPVATAANVGQGAAALAVAFKSKNKKTKSMALPSSLSAFLGITEPAIFGVNVRYRTPFIAGCIGGAAGGLLASLFGVGATAYGITGLFGFLITTDFWWQYAVVMLASTVVAFIVSFVLYKDPVEVSAAAPVADEKEKKAAPSVAGELLAPLNGKAIPLDKVSDATFASGALGNGAAIIPSEGVVYSPVDGEISMFYDTKHAIGITANDGTEILIHIGIDTVNLEGKPFKGFIKEGDKVSCGDKLVEFDIDMIKKAGCDIVTPVIITNTDDILDAGKSINYAEAVTAEKEIKKGEAFIKINKAS